jgi:phage shock protein PspC (stress-responsive transcriptional regulator)
MQVNRRLYRCRHDRRIAGVAAGVAEFFGLDPTLVRVLWFLSIFFTGGISLVLYVGMAIIVPLEPLTEGPLPDGTVAAGVEAAGLPEGHRHAASRGSGAFMTFVGVALVLFGGLALAGTLLPDHSWRYLWPAFLVGIGALLIVGAVRGREGKES